MNVVWHPLATGEMIEAARFYSDRLKELGPEFLDEVDRSVETILTDPHRFAVIEADIRLYAMPRFPYGIYFRVLDDIVRILVIKHHSREPAQGLDRL